MRMKVAMPIVAIIVTILAITSITSTVSTIYASQIPLAKAILPPSPPVSRTLTPSFGNIYLAWISNDTGHSNVLFAKSTDGGRTFSKTIFLNSPNTGKIVNANVFTALTGSDVYITWWTNKGSSGHIFRPVFRASHDNGNTFGKIVMVNSSSSTTGVGQDAGAPIVTPKVQSPVIGALIATSGKNVYMTWPSNSTGHWNVLFAKSTNAGITFRTLYTLSSPNNGKTADFGTNIGASGNDVYVYWWTNKSGKFEPVFRASHDNGNTFGNILKLNSTSGGVSK
jgi:hypothetical protein